MGVRSFREWEDQLVKETEERGVAKGKTEAERAKDGQDVRNLMQKIEGKLSSQDFESQPMVVIYEYDENGVMQAARGSGVSIAVNSDLTISKNEIQQDYEVINGQAKLAQTTTQTKTETPDGGEQSQEMAVVYANNRLDGRLESAHGKGKFTQKDKFGFSTTTGDMDQQYAVLMGQANILKAVTDTSITNLDGSSSQQKSTLEYIYDASGHLAGATGYGKGFSIEKDREIAVIETDSYQNYKIIAGQAKLSETLSISNTKHYDKTSDKLVDRDTFGSKNHQEMTVRNIYNEKGVLIVVAGEGKFKTEDFAVVTMGRISQRYEIVLGQAKLLSSNTITDAVEEFGEESPSDAAQNVLTKIAEALGLSQVAQGNLNPQTLFAEVARAGIPLNYLTSPLFKKIFDAAKVIFRYDSTQAYETAQNEFGEDSVPVDQFLPVLADAFSKAMEQLKNKEGGVSFNIKDIQILRNNPDTQIPAGLDTKKLITWSKDGVVMIHEDVLKSWLNDPEISQDIVGALKNMLLQENYEYSKFTESIAAGGKPTMTDLQVWSDFAEKNLGYKVKGIEGVFGASPAPEPKIAASSLFGSVSLLPILNILGSQIILSGVTDTATDLEDVHYSQVASALRMKDAAIEVAGLEESLNGTYKLEGNEFVFKGQTYRFLDSAWVPPTDPTQQGTFKDLGESSKERDYKFDKSSYPGFTYMRS
ncbi:MAG: hypothetical protein HYS58_02535, partial [Elusimicrobia bacterium]|nr:hypothetical protein [Elusimicrobiota bacterium]